MDVHTLLIIGHIVGTILGVGGATFIEIHLKLALKDGVMDERDREVLSKDFFLTRVGMALALLTGIGFIFEYASHDNLFRLQDGVFWGKMTIFLIIVVNAILLHKHKIGLYWGSAFSFVSWWVVMILGVYLTNGIKVYPANPILSYVSVLALYAILVLLGAVILDKIRKIGTQHMTQ